MVSFARMGAGLQATRDLDTLICASYAKRGSELQMRRAAAIDPGTSQNSFALAIAEEHSCIWRPIYLREWRGSPGAPLDLRLREGPEAARIVRDHGLDSWETDIHGWADIQLVSLEFSLVAKLDNNPLEMTFSHARRVLHEERMSLCADEPELDSMCAALEGS